MIKMFSAAMLLLSAAPVARADGEPAGVFDYYVLSLSWTPSWCATTGDARDDDQCDAGRGYGFTLHGLWPQYEDGWPAYCRTNQRDPSRAMSAGMADIMGSGGLAWYEWQKHGRCSGLSAGDYYALSRRAYEAIDRPEILRNLPRVMDIPPRVIEAAFIEANPLLSPDAVTVTCNDGLLQEIRICLTRELVPRQCARDVRRDCGLDTVEMAPMR